MIRLKYHGCWLQWVKMPANNQRHRVSIISLRVATKPDEVGGSSNKRDITPTTLTSTWLTIGKLGGLGRGSRTEVLIY